MCVLTSVNERWSELVRGTVAFSSPEGERADDSLSAPA